MVERMVLPLVAARPRKRPQAGMGKRRRRYLLSLSLSLSLLCLSSFFPSLLRTRAAWLVPPAHISRSTFMGKPHAAAPPHLRNLKSKWAAKVRPHPFHSEIEIRFYFSAHVESPLDSQNAWFGIDLALKVDIVAFLDGFGLQGGTEAERGSRNICNYIIIYIATTHITVQIGSLKLPPHVIFIKALEILFGFH